MMKVNKFDSQAGMVRGKAPTNRGLLKMSKFSKNIFMFIYLAAFLLSLTGFVIGYLDKFGHINSTAVAILLLYSALSALVIVVGLFSLILIFRVVKSILTRRFQQRGTGPVFLDDNYRNHDDDLFSHHTAPKGTINEKGLDVADTIGHPIDL